MLLTLDGGKQDKSYYFSVLFLTRLVYKILQHLRRKININELGKEFLPFRYTSRTIVKELTCIKFTVSVALNQGSKGQKAFGG